MIHMMNHDRRRRLSRLRSLDCGRLRSLRIGPRPVLPRRRGRRCEDRCRRRGLEPEVGELKQLQAAWQQGLQGSAGRFAEVDRSAVRVAASNSNRRLRRPRKSGKPMPDAVRFLAGLAAREVRARLSRPAGHRARRPGRRLESRSLGNVVGATSGRPVLMLDDLMVALRVAESSNRSGISCSIDPTPEGLQRMQQICRPALGSRRAAGCRAADGRSRRRRRRSRSPACRTRAISPASSSRPTSA